MVCHMPKILKMQYQCLGTAKLFFRLLFNWIHALLFYRKRTYMQNLKDLLDDFQWRDHRITQWFEEPSLQHELSLGCHSTCLYIMPSVPVVFWTRISLQRILRYFLTGVWEEEKTTHVMDIREM